MSAERPPDPTAAPADAELRIPAETAYVAVLRTTSAALAARHDFTLADIEDLRMAVGEAAVVALANGADGTDGAGRHPGLVVRYWFGERTATVSIATPGTVPAHLDDLSWQMMRALADDVRTGTTPGLLEIVLTHHATPLDVPS